MKIFTRALLVASLCWLGYVLFLEGREQQAIENADQSKIILTFVGVIFVALAAGTLVALAIVPAIGESVANVFVNPAEQAPHDPLMDAQARLAQGDYDGAIRIFREMIARDPSDLHALNELGRIYSEKLNDPDRAAAVYEEALQAELPHEQVAFIANKLVDIYWLYRADAESSRAILSQIIESMPGTKYSANALHRVHEIEHAVASGKLPTPPTHGTRS